MSPEREIIFVTSNDNKAREAAELLEIGVKRVSLALDEIQGMDLKKIVEHKARQAYTKLKVSAKGGQTVIVDDVSFEIDQWNKFPGPFAVWFAKTIGYEPMATMVTGNKRTARWITCLGFFDGKLLKTFTGIEEGSIARQPRGTDGWGFDTIFIPRGSSKTVAEMGFAIKQTRSARILALRKLKRYLARF